MISSRAAWYSFVFVTLIHLGGIALAVMASPTGTKPKMIEPSIQGMLIVAPKREELSPLPPKPQKKTHRRKHNKKTLPKAPPSEAAIKTPEPEPLPPAEEVIEAPQKAISEVPVPPNANVQELHNPAPVYPTMSKKLKEEGVVLLKILVTKEGRVAELDIEKSSGFKRLDDVAVKTIKRWKFNPAIQAGEPIDYWYELPVEFNLRK